ncbi:DeoR/GlpR family DNA-binding transcription regulator [Fodinicola feengrottensis]|uniref:DeoR/GlpR family DNA-binding transcription regulator n=1 Tax=Fodinicola feengrottensis TaxID=435914 RepID=A0ABN2GE73_9ACTN
MPGIAEHERQQEVLRLLETDGRVSVSDLTDRFGISAVTARKDLESLERRHLLRRVRGGAVRSHGADEGAFEMRLRHRADAKRSIARAAAALVQDGDAIALDGSTTCYYMALELRERRSLIVVTNGLRAADVLSESDSITVVLPGGTVRRSSWSLVGDFGDALTSRGQLQHGFFGLRSLSVQGGLMELSAEETTAKVRMVAACTYVHGLFDSSKIGRFSLHSFVRASRVSSLFTDDSASDQLVADWKEIGVPISRVPIVAEGAA